MSITTALSSALSGLTAASRAAEVVASNVANAQTAGRDGKRRKRWLIALKSDAFDPYQPQRLQGHTQDHREDAGRGVAVARPRLTKNDPQPGQA